MRYFTFLIFSVCLVGAQCESEAQQPSTPIPFKRVTYIPERALNRALDDAGCSYLLRLGTRLVLGTDTTQHVAIGGIACEGTYGKTIHLQARGDHEYVKSVPQCEDQEMAYYRRIGGREIAVMGMRTCAVENGKYVRVPSPFSELRIERDCSASEILHAKNIWGRKFPLAYAFGVNLHVVTSKYEFVKCSDQGGTKIGAVDKDLIPSLIRNDPIVYGSERYFFGFNDLEDSVMRFSFDKQEVDTLAVEDILREYSIDRAGGRADDPGVTHFSDADTFYLSVFADGDREKVRGLHIFKYMGPR